MPEVSEDIRLGSCRDLRAQPDGMRNRRRYRHAGRQEGKDGDRDRRIHHVI